MGAVVTRREKALLSFLAENLEKRAQNARAHAMGPSDSVAESHGAARAYQTAADYLRGARDGHESLPLMSTLGARGKAEQS